MAGICSPCQAQTIDYGSLEALFGEPVTTSATGQPQRASEVPVTMEIITADDIRRSGANNIPDVLQAYSSISVWNWTRSTYDVSVRGYNQAFSPRLLVLVNGRQVYSDSYGNTLWQNLPVQLEEIRQIEVVEGPNSAMFGFNAVGGVVNIITYNPLYDDVSSAGIRAGTNNYQQGELVHTQKLGDKVAIRISGGAKRLNEFDEPTGAFPFYDPAQHQMSIDSVIQTTDKSQLRMEATQAKSKETIYHYGYTPANNKYDTNSVKAAYTANTDLGVIQATVYRNAENVSSTGTLDSSFINNVTVAQLEDIFKLGTNHTIRLQTEYRHNALHGSLLSDEAEIFYDVYAASGMWNWKMQDDLAWTNALRVDHMDIGRSGPLTPNAALASNDAFDQQLTEVSYNSGLVWNASNKDTFRLMTARGVQAPPLLDLGIELPIAPILVLGNPNLDAGIVINYEIGYDRKIDDIDGAFHGSLFHQRTQHLKGGTLGTGLVSQPDNIGSSSLTGIELGLKGTFGEHWRWDTGYTIQKVNDDLSTHQSTDGIAYNGEDATPAHKINAHLGYATGPWEADAYAQYVSEYKVLTSNGVTYSSVDAGDNISLSGRVGYKLTDHATIAISGQQLNHADTVETSGPKKERQVFLALTTSF